MNAPSPRSWFRIVAPLEWSLERAGCSWRTRAGAHLFAEELFESTMAVEADSLMEAHESWCDAEHLHAHETRVEELASGVQMIRSYGETQSDEFVMAAHFWWDRRVARLVFRVPLLRLTDEDLSEVLAVFLEFKPLRNAS